MFRSLLLLRNEGVNSEPAAAAEGVRGGQLQKVEVVVAVDAVEAAHVAAHVEGSVLVAAVRRY